MTTKTIEKVAAFVTRQDKETFELLVFRHPNAGIQVPAGTVEIGETPRMAVLRETTEETGLQNLEIVRQLGIRKDTLAANERIVLRMTKVFDKPTFDASSPGYVLGRGISVKIIRQIGEFMEILCDPLDLDQEPPQRISDCRGYVRVSLLGSRLTRYFYLLRTSANTPTSWRVATDGHEFQLFWTPITPIPHLHPAQYEWMKEYHGAIVGSKLTGQ